MSHFEEIKHEMENRMPDIEFHIQKVEKANESYVGLVVKMPRGVCPVFAMPNEIPTTDISSFCNCLQNEIAKIKPPKYDTSFLEQYETAKGKLFLRAINYRNNSEFLIQNEIPHHEYGDIAVAPYIEMSTDKETVACSVVTSKLCKRWGKSPNDVLRDAFENSARIKPALCQTLGGVLHDLAPEMYQDKNETIESVYVISNEEKIYGASAVFYDDVLEIIANMFNGSFWILPSSTEEVLVMKEEDTAGRVLYEMVRSINATEVSENEFLSNRPLFYNRTWKTLYQFNPITDELELA